MSSIESTDAPARHKTAKDYIYGALSEAMASGRFTPGQRLLEKEISEWLGVSRTPVREAFAALEGDGLLENIPHRGAIVRRLAPTDIRDHYIVRAALESFATELAVPRLDEAALTALDEIQVEMEQSQAAGRNDAALAANRRLHMTIYSACGSDRLVELIESAWSRADYFRRFYYAMSDGPAQEAHMHHDLLERCRARDAEAARDIVKRSLLETADLLTHRIAGDEASAPGQAGT